VSRRNLYLLATLAVGVIIYMASSHPVHAANGSSTLPLLVKVIAAASVKDPSDASTDISNGLNQQYLAWLHGEGKNRTIVSVQLAANGESSTNPAKMNAHEYSGAMAYLVITYR